VYTTNEDWIRKMDDHYEDRHPGVTRQQENVECYPRPPFVNLKCPHCFNRSFSRETREAANEALDEHIATNHSCRNFQHVDWTDKDL
jgi:hypothetical protein